MLLKGAIKLTGFYAKNLFKLNSENNSISLTKNNKIFLPLVIVGKEHVFESSRDLPIASKSDAMSAAKNMTDVAPFEGKTFYLVRKLSAEKTRIYFFTIKIDVIDSLANRAVFILPETLLYQVTLFDEQTSFRLEAQRLNNKILVQNSNVQFKTSFLSTQGFLIDEDADVEREFNESQTLLFLLKALRKIPRHIYGLAYNKSLVNRFTKAIPYKSMGIAAFISLCCYIGLSSAWLVYKKQQLTTDLTEQRTSLNNVFALQAQLEEQQKSISDLSGNKKLQQLHSPIWQVLLPLVQQNVEVLSIIYVDDLYTLRLKAMKSIEVIEFLSKQSMISQPTVVSPAIQSRGKEVVTLSFKLIKGTLL